MIPPSIKNHLSQDSILKPVVDSLDIQFPVGEAHLYGALIKAIVYQQLSGKAAGTIYRRFLDLFDASEAPPAELILAKDLEELRSAGLSRQKASYIQNVATFFDLPENRKINWEEQPDDFILHHLTQIKGVGQWTVEMILIFHLNRPDILPVGDLGIQQGMIGLYGINEKGRKLKAKMTELAEPWRPYRTYGSLYIWRWKNNEQ